MLNYRHEVVLCRSSLSTIGCDDGGMKKVLLCVCVLAVFLFGLRTLHDSSTGLAQPVNSTRLMDETLLRAPLNATTPPESRAAPQHLPKPIFADGGAFEIPQFPRFLRKVNNITRFVTSRKIAKKYGLTNVLLSLASLMAYAAVDNRGVVLPSKSPVDLEHDLLHVEGTESALATVNVRIFTNKFVSGLRLKRVSMWRLGLHLGKRELAGSIAPGNASALLGKLKMNMALTRNIPIVAYGDFFLRFPFYALRPLDVCYFLKRIVFSSRIRLIADAVLERLKRRGVQSYLAVHLRIEDDMVLLDKRLRRVSAAVLGGFWSREIVPLAVRMKVQSIVVCSGELNPSYRKVLRSPVQVLTKGDLIQGLESSVAPFAGRPTTSHVGAAVDLMLMSKASAAVSMARSTFLLAVLSRRCPSSPRNYNLLKNSSLYEFTHVASRQLEEGNETWSIEFSRGVFSYNLMPGANGTHFSPLIHVGCNAPWKGHCFYR